jgi:hypothetical protein
MGDSTASVRYVSLSFTHTTQTDIFPLCTPYSHVFISFGGDGVTVTQR